MPSEKVLLSKRETAQRLSVSLRTVDNLLARGELKARRIGRRVLIHQDDLERFARHDHATQPQDEKNDQ